MQEAGSGGVTRTRQGGLLLQKGNQVWNILPCVRGPSTNTGDEIG